MATITLKQREAKKLKFESLQNNVPVDLSEAKVFFGVKMNKEDIGYVIYKDDTDFDKNTASIGKVGIFLSSDDTSINPGEYLGELKIEFADGTITKSEDLLIEIKQAVIS